MKKTFVESLMSFLNNPDPFENEKFKKIDRLFKRLAGACILIILPMLVLGVWLRFVIKPDYLVIIDILTFVVLITLLTFYFIRGKKKQ